MFILDRIPQPLKSGGPFRLRRRAPLCDRDFRTPSFSDTTRALAKPTAKRGAASRSKWHGLALGSLERRIGPLLPCKGFMQGG